MLFVLLATLLAAYSGLLLVWHIVRRQLLSTIGLASLPLFQKGRLSSEKIEGTAVICGGSIAGLLAARVCHEHFERVLIVEPEAWVATEEGRKVDGWCPRSVPPPQRVQPVVFSGMQHLFPNIEEECERSRIKIQGHNPRFSLSGQAPWRAPSALHVVLCAGRAGFETFLRRLVLDRKNYPNIEYLTGTVIDVVPDQTSPARLAKVAVRLDSTGTVREVPAALVADCTGTARAGLKWLSRHGYGDATSYPRETLPLDHLKISLDQKLRYSSIRFRLKPEFYDRVPIPEELRDTKPVYTFLEDVTEESLAKGRALFVLLREDGDQFVAFTGHYGMNRQQPKSITEMKEYVRDLCLVKPIPEWVLTMLDMLEEIQDSATVSLVKVPPTTYVQYHRAANLPSNFVALGDSVMTVNPIFGEGCAKALRCALALQIVLLRAQATSGRTLPPNFSSDFFKEERDKTEHLWDSTRTMDYGALTTEPIAGESLSSGAFARWYAKWLQRLAITDLQAGSVMYDTASGFASPIDALHPRLFAKVLMKAIVG